MRIFSFIIAMIAIYGFGYQDEYAAIAQQQREAFDFSIISQEIMDSFESGDTSVLEGYMCKNIKDNVEDLPGEIKKLMDAIPGEITSWEVETSPGYSSSTNDGNGGILAQKGLTIYIFTSEKKYNLNFIWSDVNTCYPDETGIRTIELLDPLDCTELTDENIIVTKALASIKQTEQAPYSNPDPPTVREDRQKMIDYIISCIKGTA